MRLERTACLQGQDGEKTSLMFLQIDQIGVSTFGREGAIIHRWSTPFQKYTLGSLIYLCREIRCSPCSAFLELTG